MARPGPVRVALVWIGYETSKDVRQYLLRGEHDVINGRALGGAAAHIQGRHIGNCATADPEYGAGVAAALARMSAGQTADRDRRSA
jgi:hypothetical protein